MGAWHNSSWKEMQLFTQYTQSGVFIQMSGSEGAQLFIKWLAYLTLQVLTGRLATHIIY